MSKEQIKERILKLGPKLREPISMLKLKKKNKRMQSLLESSAIQLKELNYRGVIVVSNDMELNENNTVNSSDNFQLQQNRSNNIRNSECQIVIFRLLQSSL